MNIKTKYLGDIEIKKDKIITFEKGILGFEDLRDFTILTLPENEVFQCLQSIENQNVAFIIINPWNFFKDYDIKLNDEYIKELDIHDKKQIAIYNIVTIPEDIKKMTANLLAPLVINIDSKKSKQIVLENTDYKTKHFIYNQNKEVSQNASTK